MSLPRDQFNDHLPFWEPLADGAELPPDVELSETLRWVIHQLHLGAATIIRNADGRGVAMRLGEGEGGPWPREADEDEQTIDEEALDERLREVLGPDFSEPPLETEEPTVSWTMDPRHMLAYYAGVIATGRERGTAPEFAEGHEHYRRNARGEDLFDSQVHTEYHYAMQLTDMLRAVRQRSLELRSLPLLGHASAHLLDLLHEATRAHLLGLHTASLALCRAAVEEALKQKVPVEAKDAASRRFGGRRDLEVLMHAARDADLLSPRLAQVAHRLRKRANGVLHGTTVTDDSTESLHDARLLIDHLFGSKEAS